MIISVEVFLRVVPWATHGKVLLKYTSGVSPVPVPSRATRLAAPSSSPPLGGPKSRVIIPPDTSVALPALGGNVRTEVMSPMGCGEMAKHARPALVLYEKFAGVTSPKKLNPDLSGTNLLNGMRRRPQHKPRTWNSLLGVPLKRRVVPQRVFLALFPHWSIRLNLLVTSGVLRPRIDLVIITRVLGLATEQFGNEALGYTATLGSVLVVTDAKQMSALPVVLTLLLLCLKTYGVPGRTMVMWHPGVLPMDVLTPPMQLTLCYYVTTTITTVSTSGSDR